MNDACRLRTGLQSLEREIYGSARGAGFVWGGASGGNRAEVNPGQHEDNIIPVLKLQGQPFLQDFP